MKHILKEGKIELIDPYKKGRNKEVYLLVYNHKRYILRKYCNRKTADKYEKNYYKFEKFGFLPKLLWRDKTNLIFQYIPGRNCKVSDALQVAKDVGEIAGIINSANIPIKKYNFDEKFFTILNFIKKRNILDPYKVKEVRSKYYDLKSKANPKLAIDLNDIADKNFRLHKGKVYFVDIEAIKPALKGIGIAKAMLNWFVTPKQREIFFKSYNRFSDLSFFTSDYKNFVFLYFIIRYIYRRYKGNKLQLVTHNLKKLDKLLLGEKL